MYEGIYSEYGNVLLNREIDYERLILDMEDKDCSLSQDICLLSFRVISELPYCLSVSEIGDWLAFIPFDC